MRKLKVEITIPELNMKGEIKPLKSNELLHQFEQILIENGFNYKYELSSYDETNDLTKEEILDAVVSNSDFDNFPLSAKSLYVSLFDLADENGNIYEPLNTMQTLHAIPRDIYLLRDKYFITLYNDRITIDALSNEIKE